MWKQARESGLSLAELLVVLAITVVLAAILLPALSPPGQPQAGGGLILEGYTVVADEELPYTDRQQSRRDRNRDREDTPAKPDPATDFRDDETRSGETMERDGLREIKTTDIRYVAP